MPAMRTDTPQAIRLADYRPPAFLINEVRLTFDLKPNATRVKATREAGTLKGRTAASTA